MDLRSLGTLQRPTGPDPELHNRVGVELTTPEGHTYHVGRLSTEDRRHKILRYSQLPPQTLNPTDQPRKGSVGCDGHVGKRPGSVWHGHAMCRSCWGRAGPCRADPAGIRSVPR